MWRCLTGGGCIGGRGLRCRGELTLWRLPRPRQFDPTHSGQNGFRNFNKDNAPAHTRAFYAKNVPGQTLEVVKRLREKYLPLRRGKATFAQLLDLASSVVDESDPDIDASQWQHAFQVRGGGRLRAAAVRHLGLTRPPRSDRRPRRGALSGR